MHKTLISRVIGFVASLILTLTAFLIVTHPVFFHLGIRIAIIVIFILAILQGIVQSICFLNVLSEKGPRWNLVIFISTISIVIVIIVFTIWVMNHLNYNMMLTGS
jgi:cytochrome o ubiquinol oxidase operon protein cyoD